MFIIRASGLKSYKETLAQAESVYPETGFAQSGSFFKVSLRESYVRSRD